MFNMNIVLNSIFDAYQNTHVIWNITRWHGLFIYIHAHWDCSTAHFWWGSVRVSFLFFLSTICSTTCVPFLCASKKSAGESIRIYSPENQHVPWKSMVGRCIPYWNGPFLGDMLVFWGVEYRTSQNMTVDSKSQFTLINLDRSLRFATKTPLVCRRCSAKLRFAEMLQFWCQRNKPWCSNQQPKNTVYFVIGTSGWSNVTLVTISSRKL